MELKFITGKLVMEAPGAVSWMLATASLFFFPSPCDTFMFNNFCEMVTLSRNEQRSAFTWVCCAASCLALEPHRSPCSALINMQLYWGPRGTPSVGPALSTPVTEKIKKQHLGLLRVQKHIALASPRIVPSPTVNTIEDL